MGEARRKKLLQAGAAPALTIEQIEQKAGLARISSAIRKLSEAASAHLGRDCYLHASMCREILALKGVESRLVAGFAAWRVGEGNSDVIVHGPTGNIVPQGGALPYHAWLEIGPAESRHRIILDFTTYQLREKAAQLDLLDGGHTTVSWCPNYLVATAAQLSSLSQVTKDHAGLFCYQRNEELERGIRDTAGGIDEADLRALILIYENPDVMVFGPNDDR
ncbi:hypothetical protein [Ralstonia pseudosolanacearum]|uniref:hypothetical protein n=1 Tax=Ralstonia pseudosolanacearum TaxID=1310165 RepID=UPI003CE99BF0